MKPPGYLFQLIGINTAVLVLLLALVEIAGQSWFKYQTGTFPAEGWWPAETLFEPDTLLAVVPRRNHSLKRDNKTITIGGWRDRITRIPSWQVIDSNRIRIVCLGGSTTFGTGVTDRHTYPFLLQQLLGTERFQVFNLGVPGYATHEAIIQMTTQVKDIHPDIIIHLHGWNDLHQYHLPDNLPDSKYHQKMIRDALLPQQFISERFAITKMVNAICNYFKKKPPVSPLDRPDLRVDSMYVQHLIQLSELGEELDASSIFLPQILNDFDFMNTHQTRHWTPYIQNDCMPEFIRRFNTISEYSLMNGPPGSIFLTLPIQGFQLPEVFIDEGHFSFKGNQMLAELLLDVIQEKVPLLIH